MRELFNVIRITIIKISFSFVIAPPISYLVDVRKKLGERAKNTADKPQVIQ